MTTWPLSRYELRDPMSSATPSSAFSRLHPALQEALYRMRWTKLRQIQVDAIHEIFDGTGDMIIAARTAAGKTEAAFLPILSHMLAEPSRGVRAIYVGPLKALINDQFSRLEQLCDEAEIAVHKWHGDVSSSPKRRLLEQPSGVLLITPESIESLFVNHAHRLGTVFDALAFVVIDELHSFIGTERGAHLRSLVSRLSAKSALAVRRVGLSATLGAEVGSAARWLRPSHAEAGGKRRTDWQSVPPTDGVARERNTDGQSVPPTIGVDGEPTTDSQSVAPTVRIIEDPEKKSIQLRISGYLAHARRELRSDQEADDSDSAASLESDLPKDVFETFYGKTALIFANAKRDIEQLADGARREAERRGLPDRFKVHHGSLSKGEREETEEALKATQPTATFCSSTLELGIDVGNVKLVGQIGPTWTVNSLTQRLGRSGRKDGEASVIRIFIEEDEPDQNSSLFHRLFPDLLQATAMTELLLEKWCEPPEVDRLHLSTLIQQVLSVITEGGGARADLLHRALVLAGGFPNVDQATLARVLRSMGSQDLIEQTPEGLLITGLRGEKIVRHHDFYVAFVVQQEYRVNHAGHQIGSVAFVPEFEEERFLILAGRRWRILNIDHDRKAITVEPSPGGRVPVFHSDGWEDIHPRVRQMMKGLLERTDTLAYLDINAREMLQQARATARHAGLLRTPLFQDGADTIWFTWTGTRIQRALLGLGEYFGGLKVEDEGIALVFKKASVAQVQAVYHGFLNDCPDAVALAGRCPHRVREKYEVFLSDDLTAEVFARERIDLKGAVDKIRDLGAEGSWARGATGEPGMRGADVPGDLGHES
jgi:ATP-dependent Lhr-like helicase